MISKKIIIYNLAFSENAPKKSVQDLFHLWRQKLTKNLEKEEQSALEKSMYATLSILLSNQQDVTGICELLAAKAASFQY